MSPIELSPPPAPESSEASATIAAAIGKFLCHGRIKRIYTAEGTTPPPTLGYLVHFPRLSITLKSADSMLVEQAGRARLLRVERGEAVLVPANCWNRPTWKEPSLTLNFLFGRSQVGLSLVTHNGRAPEPGSAIKASVPKTSEAPLRDIMSALIAVGGLGEGAAPLLVQALLQCCLKVLRLPVHFHAEGRAAAAYDGICVYIQEHFQFQLSRASVAEHFRVTPTHISRLFRQHGEVGFSDYLTYVRIDRAKFLLKSYEQTVGEVAGACGFTDAAYFCRIFKEITKLTPSAYRMEVRDRHRPAQRVSDG